MPASIGIESNGTFLLRLSGTVEAAEFTAMQNLLGKEIDAGAKPRILAILENFDGWERGAAWGNLDFLYWHSSEIAKIAIVADPSWESEAMAFAGADSRSAPVKFFPASAREAARDWLAE
ncbi:MAG: STAS/SEC14 domain-containing protein [Verrucomicrobiaceae bacterium]|nr:MAG: STAS/SEC14 domain-containing protein [Verrucomicrobiaceae bacterium]